MLPIISISLILGLIAGSFLNVLTLRLPKDEPAGGRSKCPHCGHQLAAKDLVPVVSFIYLKGRCRYCGKRISARYILIELITALLFFAVAYFNNPTELFGYIVLIRDFVAVTILLTVFITDFEHYLIFDKVVFWGLGLMLAFNLLFDILHRPLEWYYSYTISGIVGALVPSLALYSMWRFSRGKWLGFGDVKFMLFIGALLGSLGVIVSFFLSFILGAAVSIPLLVLDKAGLKSKLPLGCFFAVATFITMFWGTDIIKWYIDLVGFNL